MNIDIEMEMSERKNELRADLQLRGKTMKGTGTSASVVF